MFFLIGLSFNFNYTLSMWCLLESPEPKYRIKAYNQLTEDEANKIVLWKYHENPEEGGKVLTKLAKLTIEIEALNEPQKKENLDQKIKEYANYLIERMDHMIDLYKK
jgi:hypothetical protein